MVLLSVLAITFAIDGAPMVATCYVQSATPGCRIVRRGETSPARVLARLQTGSFLQAPKGGNVVVVFRKTGARFRLIGAGQARITGKELDPVNDAEVRSLGRVDLRLAGDARRDARYGRNLGGLASGVDLPAEAIVFPPETLPRPPAPSAEPLAPIPPLVLPLTPNGTVREAPAEIVLTPTPPDGPVTLRRTPLPGSDAAATRLATVVTGGRVAVPLGFFGNDAVAYTVDAGETTLASGEVRVLSPAQRAALERTERLAATKGDDGLIALALIYDDLGMISDENRLLREILTRRPGDLALRAAIEALRPDASDR